MPIDSFKKFIHHAKIHTGNAHFSFLLKSGISMPFIYALLIVPLSIVSLSWVSQAFPEEFPELEIETLEIIEITGSVVEPTLRDMKFPSPEIQPVAPLDQAKHLSQPELRLSKPAPTHSRIILDQTAATRKLFTPVKPLKTEHPPYPRQAREQGWEGRIILRLHILPDGTVASGTIHQSSGHPLLDESAMTAARQWTFQPAKNGMFPVASTVNIPIQFDLRQ